MMSPTEFVNDENSDGDILLNLIILK